MGRVLLDERSQPEPMTNTLVSDHFRDQPSMFDFPDQGVRPTNQVALSNPKWVISPNLPSTSLATR